MCIDPNLTRRRPKIQTRVGSDKTRKPLNAHIIPIEIIKPLGGTITCLSNSRWWQKVVLTWGTTTITFEGAGQGMSMKLADGASVYPIMPSLQRYTIEAQFFFSKTGAQGPFQQAIAEAPIFIPNRHHTQILIAADVAIEHVNNDVMLMINYERMDKPKRMPVAVPLPAQRMSRS